MLFRKNMDPACAYCTKGKSIDETEVVCKKRGIVEPWSKCRAFAYDPYKREPPRPPKLKKISFDDIDIAGILTDSTEIIPDSASAAPSSI